MWLSWTVKRSLPRAQDDTVGAAASGTGPSTGAAQGVVVVGGVGEIPSAISVAVTQAFTSNCSEEPWEVVKGFCKVRGATGGLSRHVHAQ